MKLGMNTCYGDGTTLPLKTVSHVRDTVWKNLVFNRWQQGDVLMIDNFRVSHGRQVSVHALCVCRLKKCIEPGFLEHELCTTIYLFEHVFELTAFAHGTN